MEDVGRRRLADELGNGRFVRSLLENAGRARNVRVMAGGAEPTPAELVTLEEADLAQAGAELTARVRGQLGARLGQVGFLQRDQLSRGGCGAARRGPDVGPQPPSPQATATHITQFISQPAGGRVLHHPPQRGSRISPRCSRYSSASAISQQS